MHSTWQLAFLVGQTATWIWIVDAGRKNWNICGLFCNTVLTVFQIFLNATFSELMFNSPSSGFCHKNQSLSWGSYVTVNLFVQHNILFTTLLQPESNTLRTILVISSVFGKHNLWSFIVRYIVVWWRTGDTTQQFASGVATFRNSLRSWHTDRNF